jgi:hypothetical protein
MGKNNQAAEDANAPQDTNKTVDESLESAPEPETHDDKAPSNLLSINSDTKTVPLVYAEQHSTDGLVKMDRGDAFIHSHPDVVGEHLKNGWKVS